MRILCTVGRGAVTAIVAGMIAVTAAEASPLSLGDTVYLSNISFPNGSGGAWVTTSLGYLGPAGGGYTRLTLNFGSVFSPDDTFYLDAYCIDPPISVRYGAYIVAPLDNKGFGWEMPRYGTLTDLQKAQLGWLMHQSLEVMPDPANSARRNTSIAYQMAVWTVLYPSSSWSYFDSNFALRDEFDALMASIPTDITPEQYPVYQLVWRNEDGSNYGQPWLIPAPRPEIVLEPASAALMGVGLFGLAALRRRLH